MTNVKATKKALFMSILPLLLCFTMLMGATFAWFTDTVTSSNNKIVAGTLKVDLELLDKESGSWGSIKDSKAPIFDYDNWEPGYVDVKVLKIENEGSLALKWFAKFVSEVELSKIANVIEVYVLPSENEIGYPANRNIDGYTYVGTAAEFINTIEDTTHGTLEAGKAAYLGIALKMQESAGNEYQGMDLGGAFDITVLATQLTYEEDSFGNDYDADATYAITDADDLAKVLAEGKNASLESNLSDVPVKNTAPYGNYYGVKQDGGVLDGNGNTLDFDMGELKDGKADNYGIMTSGGTIKNVTITGVFRGIMIMNPTEDIIIDNVTIGDEDMCYAINTGEGDGTHKLIVKNSTIKGWNSYGTAIKSVTFINTTFAQGEYYSNVYGRLVKPYVDAVFDGCEFNSKYYIDLSQLGKDGDGNVLNPDAKIILKNCTVNGVKLTAENWKSLIVSEGDCGNEQISIEAKDGSYMTADNVLDYVIIQ